MKRMLGMLMVSGAACIAGCGGADPDRPPEVIIGDSVCAECNMIISDERWATATVVDGPRGPTPLLFDDFNCQVNHEARHTDLSILTRWSHSHASSAWIRTGDAVFLVSPGLRSPMGSGVAAYAGRDEADAFLDELGGDLVGFDEAWEVIEANEREQRGP